MRLSTVQYSHVRKIVTVVQRGCEIVEVSEESPEKYGAKKNDVENICHRSEDKVTRNYALMLCRSSQAMFHQSH